MIVEENLEISVEPNGGWDPRIVSVKCGDLVRAFLIKTERFVVVYDTLLGPKSGGFLREQALKLANGSRLIVVNSHADWDHYFGNMMFPEPILSSELMVQRISSGIGQRELEKKRKEHPESYNAVELSPPCVGLPSFASLYGGDLTVELTLVKGHRPDHLCLYIPEIATILPGDCVEEPIPLIDEDSDEKSTTLSEFIETLHRFLRVHPKWILANHAPPEQGVARVEANLAYLENLRTQACEAPSFEDFAKRVPASPQWDDFYQQAHQNHIRMAWQQTRGQSRKWAED
jgi:glyoxylase-like metal-dependent hydrolase (beta-lactamase superfamily II)